MYVVMADLTPGKPATVPLWAPALAPGLNAQTANAIAQIILWQAAAALQTNRNTAARPALWLTTATHVIARRVVTYV